jgi:hypothetical protein
VDYNNRLSSYKASSVGCNDSFRIRKGQARLPTGAGQGFRISALDKCGFLDVNFRMIIIVGTPRFLHREIISSVNIILLAEGSLSLNGVIRTLLEGKVPQDSKVNNYQQTDVMYQEHLFAVHHGLQPRQ